MNELPNGLRWWKSSRSGSSGGACVEVAITQVPLYWWKSSRSGSSGGQCVEVAVAPAWWKSSRSGSSGGNCVEVAATGTAWLVRDSKDPDGGVLAVTDRSWHAFVSAIRSGVVGGQ